MAQSLYGLPPNSRITLRPPEKHSSVSWWKDRTPVVLHADDGPASCSGLIETSVELADMGIAVVGPLTFSVGVVDEYT
jgi:hypothetical protein